MSSGHLKNPHHASCSESGPNRPAARNLRVDKSREIDLLLDQSERQGLCLATKDRCLRKALLTRACAGMLVSPAPGLFARASHWHGLTPSAKSLHIHHAGRHTAVLVPRHPGHGPVQPHARGLWHSSRPQAPREDSTPPAAGPRPSGRL